MNSSPDRQLVHVSLGPRSYEILIASDRLASIAEAIGGWLNQPAAQKPARRVFIIADANVAGTHAAAVERSLAAAGWQCRCFALPSGESSKSLESTGRMYDWLVEHEASRDSVIVAVGGGVVGDAAGFVAATYARGIPFIQVPTTLLAQVDSSVGGKVGVNHARAKNLIGAFFQPCGVFIDTSTLATLPEREYRSGLAEVVKYGVILDADLFASLEQYAAALTGRDPTALRHVISRSCRLKADIVEQDECELTGLRAVLNYGHTFAHAFEALCGYGTLLHGEAVAIGMNYAARLAQRVGLVDAILVERQSRLLTAFSLPIRLPATEALDPDEVIGRMRLDKKSVSGRLRFVLPTQLGHVGLFDNISEDDVRQVLGELG